MLPDTQEVFSVTKEICLGNYWVRKYVVMQTFCYTSRHCNTWLLQDHLSLMLCSKCVCLCMIRKLHVCLLWSASFDTFRALLTLVSIYILPPLINSSPILMQIGVDVQTPEDSHLGIVYILVTTSSIGPPNDNLSCLVPVLKLNIVESLM
jgi:hypothetical protein